MGVIPGRLHTEIADSGHSSQLVSDYRCCKIEISHSNQLCNAARLPLSESLTGVNTGQFVGLNVLTNSIAAKGRVIFVSESPSSPSNLIASSSSTSIYGSDHLKALLIGEGVKLLY